MLLRFRTLACDDTGGAFIEFALFAPILVAMLLGATQIGLLALQMTQVHAMAEAGVLSAIYNTTKLSWSDTTTPTKISNDIAQAGIATPSSSSASCYYGCPNIGLTDVTPISGFSCDTTVTKNPPPGLCSAGVYTTGSGSGGDAPGQYATVNVAVATNSIVGRISWLPNTLSAKMTVRVK